MSNLVQRTLSGALYCAVVIGAILYSQYAVGLLFAAISVWAVVEYGSLMKLDSWMKTCAAIGAALLCTCHVLHVSTSGYLLFCMMVLMAELFRKQDNPMQNWGNYLVSQMMIAWPFAIMNNLLLFHGWNTGKYILLALFVCIWSNDTGAYCVGSLIGKHKMFPRVSPGKSWEGLVGGFIFSLIAGYVFAMFIPTLALWEWLLLAFTISCFGTFGDLMESLLKRSIGVKDSGKFLPGHGGVLDRFDSVLLATPAIYVLIQLFSILTK